MLNFRVRIRVRFTNRIRFRVWVRFSVRVKIRDGMVLELGCSSFDQYSGQLRAEIFLADK